MWDMKVKNIPIVIGAIGLIRKAMEKNIKNLPGTMNIEQCQKSVILRTTHILCRALAM